MKTAVATLLGLLLSTSAFASSITLTVGGTSDPFLAGALPGTHASGGDDVLEFHGPVLVPAAFSLVPGSLIKFEVTGGVLNVPGCLPPFNAPPCVGPDGGAMVSHFAGDENNMDDVLAPLNALMGVFLGPGLPGPHPAHGLFNPGTNFSQLSPDLQQVFFIGDGNNILGNDQYFRVPLGATRLFLATMDGFQWANNSGQFTVTIEDAAAVPEPASIALLGTGLGLAALRLRRRRSR